MKARDLDTQDAGQFAWAAARDAGRYSDECRMTYTSQQRARAETFLDLVKWAYTGRQFYVTYRKRFITVKVEQPRQIRADYAREIQAICQDRGYDIVRTAQGLSWRMPRA